MGISRGFRALLLVTWVFILVCCKVAFADPLPPIPATDVTDNKVLVRIQGVVPQATNRLGVASADSFKEYTIGQGRA